MSEIVFEKVTKIYSDDGIENKVIDSIDLRIEPGEFTIFVGPSGCGKSTILRMVAGLEDISDGYLKFDGEVVNHKSPSERGIGMVFQSYALYPHMSVAENIGFPLRMAGIERARMASQVAEVAEMLEITALLDSKPGQLSGGQRQRVAIGRALVRNPKVFLLDEPLSNLDSALRGRMRRSLASYHKQLGCTVIYVTHDQREAMTLADKVVILRGGFIEQYGSPYDLYESPETKFVAEFIGTPRMNFVDVRFECFEAGNAEISIGPTKLSVAVGASRLSATVGDSWSLGLRPGHLHIVDEASSEKCFTATVDQLEYMGGESLVHVILENTASHLVVKCGSRVKLGSGDRVGLAFDSSDAYLFDTNERAVPRPCR